MMTRVVCKFPAGPEAVDWDHIRRNKDNVMLIWHVFIFNCVECTQGKLLIARDTTSFFFFFRLFPSGVATADFPSPVVSINSIFLRHFNLSHVLFHHIHKPPFWPSPFPFLHAIQLWMIIWAVTAWNGWAHLSHTVRWQMTSVICRTMRRRECKLFFTSVTCRLSPNQWWVDYTSNNAYF